MDKKFRKETYDMVDILYYETLKEAQAATNDYTTNSFTQSCPVILFFQSGRVCANAAIPIKIVTKILKSNPAEKNSSLEAVIKSRNRPLDKEHCKNIARYITESINSESKYIMPSVTVNATSKQTILTFEPPQGNISPIQLGYLILSFDDESLSISDGQHRIGGIDLALKELDGTELEKLKIDSIPITFYFESDINQVHQDFADCSKTKPLPKSMIAVYDRREPSNKLILDIITECTLFSDGRTDSSSKTLSKKSTSFMLTNSIKVSLKGLLTGQHSMQEQAFDKFTQKITSDLFYDEKLKEIIHIFTLMTESNPILKEISTLPKGPQRQKIPAYREQYLISNPFGFALACMVINRYQATHNINIDDFIVRLMTDIDWKKSSTLWHGNIITINDGKYSITSLNAPTQQAIINIGNQLGVNLDIISKDNNTPSAPTQTIETTNHNTKLNPNSVIDILTN